MLKRRFMLNYFIKPKEIFSLSIILISYVLIINISQANANKVIDFNQLEYNHQTKKEIAQHVIFSKTEVDIFDQGKKQKLNFLVTGLHTKSCTFALRKLSQYENFKHYLSFVKKSTYDDTTQKIRLLLDSYLMPFPMILFFKLPRIKKPGRYPFSFNLGFLKGLTGEIHVSTYENKCLFHTQAKWVGPATKIPDILFEFFTSSLSKLAMGHLFRISKTLSAHKKI